MPLIAKRPTQRLVDIVGALGGQWSGYEAMCCCPVHQDRSPSLSLRQGDHAILVHCFAGCNSNDVLRELRQIRADETYTLPTETGSRSTGNVERLWAEALPLSGTIAERYLDLRNLLPAAHDLKFHPKCPYLPKPRTRYLPALLVPVRENRKLVAVQRIFLDPHSGRYTFKAMLGRPLAGAWRGEGGGNILAIAEGFETAHAFELIHNIPTWASLGATRLPLLNLPDRLTKLILAEDNDEEGRAGALKAGQGYARDGLEIIRAAPPRRYKDWAAVRESAR